MKTGHPCNHLLKWHVAVHVLLMNAINLGSDTVNYHQLITKQNPDQRMNHFCSDELMTVAVSIAQIDFAVKMYPHQVDVHQLGMWVDQSKAVVSNLWVTDLHILLPHPSLNDLLNDYHNSYLRDQAKLISGRAATGIAPSINFCQRNSGITSNQKEHWKVAGRLCASNFKGSAS